MEDPKVIKKFDPIQCPHCKGEFYVSSQVMLPTPFSAITDEEIKKARKEIVMRLEEVKFVDESDKKEVLKYLETAIVDMSDIEPILKQIAMEQTTKELKLKNK